MSKEMRKFASILFALVLVLSFTLIPPAPVAAATAISKVIDRQLAVNTQSTQSWKEAASITLTQDGSWLVFTSFDFGVDDTGTNGEVRLQQDGTTELQYGRYEDKESGETYKSWFWMTRVERSGSNVDLDLDFQPRGSDTARICNAIIAAIRLDDLGTEDTDWRWNEEEAEHGNLGITWTAANNIILTETWTPSAEDWLIIANMEIRSDDTSENAEGRLSLNDETPVYDFATEEAEDGSEWRWWSSVRLLTLPGSEQKFEIQARSTENDTDARRARFFAVRKACFDQVVEFRDDTYAAPSAINTWEEKVDAYFTPNQTEDVLILGHAGIDFGHEDRYGRTRVHEEETDELMHSDYTTADDSDLAPVAFADIFTNWDTSTHDADLDINASNTGVTFGHAAVIFVSLTLPAAVPGITVNPTSGLDTTEAGGTDTFTVVLNTQPSAGVTVGISSDDTSEGTVLPTSLTFTSLNWSTAQTVTLTGEDDDVDDGDIPYNIATAAAVSGDGDYNGINPADVSVTNQDDDTAGVTIAETAGSTNVDEEGPTSDTYSVVLDSEPTDDVVISITPDAQVTVDPTALTFGSGNWSTPQDVTVTAVDDAVIEWAHTGTITHSASSGDVKYNGISIDDVITNIADNDGADVAIQLAMILDGSGSTSSGDWSIIKNGLAAAIEGGVLCPQRSATNNTGVFSDPTNAYADSGDYATATNGQVHQYYGYNFTIPDGATINGIEVRLDAWRETFTDASIAVELSWDGGGNWTSTGYSEDLSYQTSNVEYYGGDDDDWEHAWTASEVNTGLRVRLNVTATGWVRLDWVPVTVCYQSEGCIPLDGSVELTVIQFSDDAELEVGPVILTGANAAAVADDITNISQMEDYTCISCGICLAADTLAASPCFNASLKQALNLVTDGEPNRCSCSGSTCGYTGSESGCNATASAECAREYALTTLQMTDPSDEFDVEFIGSQGTASDWLKDEIVWPEQTDGNGYYAPPFDKGPGWVRVVADANEFAETICEKFAVILQGSITIKKETDPDGSPQSFNFTGTGGLGSFNLSDDGSKTFSDLLPGTYNFTETVPGDWTLSSVNCTGGTCTNITNGVSINLASGDDVTCTFYNKQGRGKITIKKETDPDKSSQSFNFSATGGLGSFNLSDDGSKTFSDLLPGTYNFTETVPDGWTLSSVNCTGGTCTNITNGVSINLASGDDVTCTFNNTQGRGKITIKKETDPDKSPQSFNFSATGGLGSFNLSDDGSKTFSDLLPGTYNFTETVPGGWTLTSVNCTGGTCTDITNGVSINLASGDDVTCTFNNKQDTGKLEVVKDLDPFDDPGKFDLQIDGVTKYTDASDGDITGEQTVNTGTHTVGEVAGTGTSLDDYVTCISCKDNNGTGTEVASSINAGPLDVTISKGDDIVCTITNTKKGSITIEKQTLPDGGTGFEFTDNVEVPNSFSLNDDQTKTFSNVLPGTYNITEGTLPADWDLTSIVCDDANSTGDVPTATATIKLEAGETVTCIFTNEERIPPQAIIGITKTPTDGAGHEITQAYVGDTIVYVFEVENPGMPDLIDVTLTDDTVICDTGPVRGPDKVGNNDDTLEPGEIWVYTCSHVVTAGDNDPLVNTATARGYDESGVPTEDDDDATVDIVTGPPPVGGEAYPVNKLAILMQWITSVLGGLIAQ